MAEHTPGPWYNEAPMLPGGNSHRVICGGPHGLPHIAYVPKNQYAAREDEAEANARLIAAAPRMLALCERIAELTNGTFSESDMLDNLTNIGDEARAIFKELS